MARSRRTRASRALLAFVVIAIALGSVFQFHRLKRAAAAAAPKPAANITPDVMNIARSQSPSAPAAPKPVLPMVTSAIISQTPSTRPSDASSSTPSAPSAPIASAPRTTTPPPPPANFVAQSNDPISAHPLNDAKTKADAGDLLAARKTLNDALLAGSADPENLKKQIAQINQTLVFSPKHFANDPYGGVYTVKPGQKLGQIANEHVITWQLLLRLNGMSDPRKLRAGQSLKVLQGPFHAVVSKSKFTLDIYLGSPNEPGSMYITTYGVGLGKDDSTPTGTWMIKDKVTHPTYYSPRGEGVIAADDPKNPLGPYWLGLTGTDGHAIGKSSYGIHGTIEPDSIGKMSSMGCIRLHNEDIALVYELLVEGKSTVIVKD
jgi:lipoprotein-anchoring transpeptidase ErfK/SrfK